jgi:hypothetical protein
MHSINYQILFYHGETPELVAEIEEFCRKTHDGFVFFGNLDVFRMKYGSRFMFIPANDLRKYDILAITHKNTFGQY